MSPAAAGWRASGPLSVFWCVFSFHQGCWWTRSLQSWGRWFSWRQGVRRYHNSQCTDTLAGFLGSGCWNFHTWAIFLNCKHIRIFRLSASGLKAFNRTINCHKCTATGDIKNTTANIPVFGLMNRENSDECLTKFTHCFPEGDTWPGLCVWRTCFLDISMCGHMIHSINY